MHILKLFVVATLSAALLSPAPGQFALALPSDKEQDQRDDAPSLTIYNQQFAVVRQKLPLDLRSGVNHVQVTDITAHLEPDSVILRPFETGRRLQILEQKGGPSPRTLSVAALGNAVCNLGDFKNRIGFRLDALQVAGAVERRNPLAKVVKGQRRPLCDRRL